MDSVEIVALADTSIHGKENVVKTMREIDEDRYAAIFIRDPFGKVRHNSRMNHGSGVCKEHYA